METESLNEHKAKSSTICRFYRHVDLPNGSSTEACKIDPMLISMTISCGPNSMCGFYKANTAE